MAACCAGGTRWDPYVKLTVKLTSPLKLWRARSRLYRRQFLQPNTHLDSLVFEIFKTPIAKLLEKSASARG